MFLHLFVHIYFFCLGFLSQTFTNHSTKGEVGGWGGDILLTPHYHFHLLHRHLDISRAITAESLPLHIASSRTQTQVANHYAARPIYLYICPICILIYIILIRFLLYLSKCPWCSVYLRSGAFWRKDGIQHLHCQYLIPKAYISLMRFFQVSQSCKVFL